MAFSHLASLETKLKKSVKSDKLKPLAQYLAEYINQEYVAGRLAGYDKMWRKLLEQALDAYESTQQVKIKIEKQ